MNDDLTALFPEPRPDQSAIQLTITGFEEAMIARRFGALGKLLDEQPLMGMRACAFAELHRRGMKDTDAYKTAMGLTVGEVLEVYPPAKGADQGVAESNAETEGKEQ